jgi:hypothetical protein
MVDKASVEINEVQLRVADFAAAKSARVGRVWWASYDASLKCRRRFDGVL